MIPGLACATGSSDVSAVGVALCSFSRLSGLFLRLLSHLYCGFLPRRPPRRRRRLRPGRLLPLASSSDLASSSSASSSALLHRRQSQACAVQSACNQGGRRSRHPRSLSPRRQPVSVSSPLSLPPLRRVSATTTTTLGFRFRVRRFFVVCRFFAFLVGLFVLEFIVLRLWSVLVLEEV